MCVAGKRSSSNSSTHKKQDVWDNLNANKDSGDAMKKADNETTKLVFGAIDEFNRSFK